MPQAKSFAKEWDGGQKRSLGEFLSSFRSKEPMKYRLGVSSYRLRSVISRIDSYIGRLEERDKLLFNRVVEAQVARDQSRATMYANEVAEIRKIIRQLMSTRIALEQVVLRMETIEELGDVYAELAPVVGVVNELKTMMKGVMPEISMELAEVGEGLNEVITESGGMTGNAFTHISTSPEARRILDEAASVAEAQMRDKFPTLPVGNSVKSQDHA